MRKTNCQRDTSTINVWQTFILLLNWILLFICFYVHRFSTPTVPLLIQTIWWFFRPFFRGFTSRYLAGRGPRPAPPSRRGTILKESLKSRKDTKEEEERVQTLVGERSEGHVVSLLCLDPQTNSPSCVDLTTTPKHKCRPLEPTLQTERLGVRGVDTFPLLL